MILQIKTVTIKILLSLPFTLFIPYFPSFLFYLTSFDKPMVNKIVRNILHVNGVFFLFVNIKFFLTTFKYAVMLFLSSW